MVRQFTNARLNTADLLVQSRYRSWHFRILGCQLKVVLPVLRCIPGCHDTLFAMAVAAALLLLLLLLFSVCVCCVLLASGGTWLVSIVVAVALLLLLLFCCCCCVTAGCVLLASGGICLVPNLTTLKKDSRDKLQKSKLNPHRVNWEPRIRFSRVTLVLVTRPDQRKWRQNRFAQCHAQLPHPYSPGEGSVISVRAWLCLAALETGAVAMEIPDKYRGHHEEQLSVPLKSTVWACADALHDNAAPHPSLVSSSRLDDTINVKVLTLSLPSSKTAFSQPCKENCITEGSES